MKKLILCAALMLTALSQDLYARRGGVTNGCETGTVPTVEAMFGWNTDNSDFTNFNTNFLYGYQFNNSCYFGGGVGLDVYHWEVDVHCPVGHYHESDNDLYVPVFANFKYTFMNKKVSPVLDVRSGLMIGDGCEGFAQVGAGCRIAFGKHAFVPYAGYKNVFTSDNSGYFLIGAAWEF